MAEPEDVIVPILRSIQERLSSMERRLVSGFAEVNAKQLDHDDRFDATERLMTFHLGLTTEHTHRLKELEDEMKALKSRVSALETSS